MNFLKSLSIYYLLVFFLLSLYVLGSFEFGVSKVALQFSFPVLGTVIFGIIFDFLELKRFERPLSPFITGMIIGLVARFGEDPFKLFAIGAIAMALKFLLKFEGRNIFNPAASGLLIGLLFFKSSPSWWSGGENLWAFLIWIPIFLYKFKRWAPMVGFLVPVTIFSGINVLFSSSLLFFTSVMLIEPKTSPSSVKLGLIYGIVVGVGYLISISQNTFDPLIVSLLIGNLGARILGKFLI